MARGKRHPGKESFVEISGLDQWIDSLTDASKRLPRTVRYAINAAANDIRDQARASVNSSPYNLSHHSWGIKARASHRNPYASLVGYYVDKSDGDMWHIKFYDKGAKRKNRGVIQGGHFLRDLHNSADDIAQKHMDRAIELMLASAGVIR